MSQGQLSPDIAREVAAAKGDVAGAIDQHSDPKNVGYNSGWAGKALGSHVLRRQSLFERLFGKPGTGELMHTPANVYAGSEGAQHNADGTFYGRSIPSFALALVVGTPHGDTRADVMRNADVYRSWSAAMGGAPVIVFTTGRFSGFTATFVSGN